MSGEEAAVLISGMVFFSPAVIVGVVLRHREKMQMIRNRQEGAPGLVEEMRALRAEVATLRDTTTRFDMSFDAALAKVEQRLDTVEQSQGTTSSYATKPAIEADEPAVLQARRG